MLLVHRRIHMLKLLGLTALACIVLGGMWLRLEVVSRHFHSPPLHGDGTEYLDMGKSLLEKRSFELRGQTTANRGFLYPGAIAVAGLAWPPLTAGKVRVFLALLGTLTIVMAWFMGRLVHSSPCGLLAAALVSVNGWMIGRIQVLNIPVFYAFLTAIVAWAVIDWSRKPSPKNTCLIGLAVGLSLTARSTLFLFPFLLLAVLGLQEFLSGRTLREIFAGMRKTAAILLICSFFPLAPWVVRNLYQFGEFIPFEKDAAVIGIYDGSLGLVDVREDYESILCARGSNPSLDEAISNGAESDVVSRMMRAMAIRNVLGHPFRYLMSCLKRLAVLVGYLADMFGFWGIFIPFAFLLNIKNRQVWALGALIAYFLVIHAPMAIQVNYVIPLVPVMAVLAAWGGVSLCEKLIRWYFRAPC